MPKPDPTQTRSQIPMQANRQNPIPGHTRQSQEPYPKPIPKATSHKIRMKLVVWGGMRGPTN